MKYTLEQLQAHRAKWTAALRSGEYKQGRDELLGSDGYCCLGVMAKIAGKTDDQIYGEGTLRDFPEVMDFFGLRDHCGEFDGGDLAILNDGGTTFPEIADIIDSEPEGLFIDPEVQS